MKAFRFFIISAVLVTVCAWVSASETSDNFAKWVNDFAASDINTKRDAQQNWQNFCRQQGHIPEVQKEIIRVSAEQLVKDNPVETAVWIVRQLGAVGDATAVPTLAKCLTNSEVRIRDEAARALANIPGREAEAVLKSNNAILTAQLAKDALTSRTIKAAPPKAGVEKNVMAIPYTATIAKMSADAFAKADNMVKAQILTNVAAHYARIQVVAQQRRLAGASTAAAGGTEARNFYLPLALEAAKSSDETLRNAGLLAIGALGGPAEVPFLIEQARSGANQHLAKLALARMSGQKIDDLLLESAKAESDAGKFAFLAEILRNRYNSGLRPDLLTKAKAADTPNRLDLLQLAEPFSSKTDVPDFVKVWTMITDRGQKDRAEQIIARLSQGDAGVATGALGNNWDTPEAMSLLGRIGDAKILDKVRESKNAFHAFRTWPNAVVADDLMKIARDDKYSEEDRTLALRAFIRVISLPNDQIGIRINDVQKVNRLIEVYELAKRVDEKRLIIERIGYIRTVESLRFVLKYMDDTELQERVCWAVLELAHHNDLRRSALQEFVVALDKVLEVTTNDGYRNRANGYKAQQ